MWLKESLSFIKYFGNPHILWLLGTQQCMQQSPCSWRNLHSSRGQRSLRRKVRLGAGGWWAVSDRVIWEYFVKITSEQILE